MRFARIAVTDTCVKIPKFIDTYAYGFIISILRQNLLRGIYNGNTTMSFPLQQIEPGAFPLLLKEIPDSPKSLYIRGPLPPDDYKWLCVVGSRKYSSYGKDACTALLRGLSGYPVVIVSGLALGIDGIAHHAALQANLKTVAVPGSGLDNRALYPASHFQLAMRILNAGGALLSEFEPLWKPRPESFPQRNRIMAGLSHAVLVVEAEEISGTLITSRLATEYNRDVLTIPHPVFSKTGEGPHMLMRLGATPVRTSLDILEALGIDAEYKKTTPQTSSDLETKVLLLLREPTQKDALIQALGMSARDANVLLSTMELKGTVKEEHGSLRRI